MKKTPTIENTTHDPDGAPAESSILRECELLLQHQGSPELDAVRAHLLAIEGALRGEPDLYGNDLLQHVVDFENERRGLDTEHKRIRHALDIVQEAIDRGDLSEESTVILRLDLRQSDVRYGDLEMEAMKGRLQQAANSTTSTGNQGRGKLGAPATLASFMAEVGAHGIECGDIEHAKRKVKNAKRETPPKRSVPTSLEIIGGLVRMMAHDIENSGEEE